MSTREVFAPGSNWGCHHCCGHRTPSHGYLPQSPPSPRRQKPSSVSVTAAICAIPLPHLPQQPFPLVVSEERHSVCGSEDPDFVPPSASGAEAGSEGRAVDSPRWAVQ